MTTIPYTYQILNVGPRSMEVAYSNPTHGVVHVGVRRPKVGETTEDVIAEYSPAAYWLEQAEQLAEVEAGATGAGETVFPDPPAPLTPEEELAIWRESAVASAFQFRYTLQQWGLFDQAQAIVNQVGEPLVTAFEYAIEVRRMSPSILGVFNLIVMPDGNPPSDADLDQFWTEAMMVEV
jgi:hypothetical protein